MFSGYVPVNAEGSKQIFYWFVEAENDADTAPVVLWTNGVFFVPFTVSPRLVCFSSLLSFLFVLNSSRTSRLFRRPHSSHYCSKVGRAALVSVVS
jgi:hypothetical protein